MKDTNHDIGRIVLFYIVMLGVWVPLSQGGITPKIFIFGVIFQTAILYQLLGLYSSGTKAE